MFSQVTGAKNADAWDNCCDTEDAADERPFLYKQSPDGGVFLSAQPIPKSGAFCYLTVINKKT